MLNRIIYFSIHNKLVIGLLTLALICWGTMAALRLPIDAVPDITNNQVQVITWSPSLSPQEVEQLITYPVEFNISNIPNLLEIRSISRFGLSVVTAVFADQTDIYWARQQVTERLKAAIDQIPAGVGTPELGPVSTGLSEIYQYTIQPKKGFEKRFSPTELRSIQDWQVRRQLMGTPGVADISSFGGFVKQYEVSLDPQRVRNYGLTLPEIFGALQKSNENSGGAYIAKGSQSWYIRSEGMIRNLSDIESVVLKKTANGLPVTIKDIGTARFGHSVRYGALTQGNNGEAVGGIVLMLKGENSSQVISRVKERMALVEKSLPNGLEINVYLDRSDLIGRAIHTVTTNLIEGALIVIFVLVLLLGNLRAGIVVASVIPLAMLFALGMMDLFGVSGNLMSLGAIDFGLIVDGAVIIVEATLHHIVNKGYTHRLSQKEMDQEVFASASKIRNSAAFGEIIILIVYLPLLALVGIEGKMFRPMAQTVSFAILGAFILSLSYVPMVSALLLSKNPAPSPGISDKILSTAYALYLPVLHSFLRNRKWVIAASAGLLAISIWLFGQLGGEFIPGLDEGDFAVETRLLPGTSIEKTVEVTLKAAQILKTQFPEVKEVVGKIGTSEIPTDPMPFEACDLMIILHDRSTWTTAETKDQLAEKMQAALAEIPGVNFGFQQPIQMRFNELMTGARQDVAIKIYGENLDELSAQALKMSRIIGRIDGVEDLYVESVTGLPQMVATLKRDQIALHGLHIEEVNQTLQTAFAGGKAGTVFEGEKRFDLVVRLDSTYRDEIEDLQNLYIATATGLQIPLSQLADVSFKPGPNQIQRDDAKRRITVAFNVRGRDVESIVNEINQRCETKLHLPPGYYYTIGGQFKNLIEARDRLSVAVPVALLLIFVLLFFTFQSVPQSLMIFSAIPLSAIGGIWALWLRNMPFSISAGVGFIALFGVAVLNGIVLMGEFNHLKKQFPGDLKLRILKATENRLRPVLMTALVASLGFLPMALSTGAGAEVQKPLATVVIGGLVSATLLTLLILPVLYYIVEKGISGKARKIMAIAILLGISPLASFSQTKPLSLKEAIRLATEKHPSIQVFRLQTEVQKNLKAAAMDIGKTSAMFQYGQFNGFPNDNNLTISQTVPFPTVLNRQKSWQESQINVSEQAAKVSENELIFEVKKAYHQLVYFNLREEILLRLDSLYKTIEMAAALRFKTGEANLLEQALAQSQRLEIEMLLKQTEGKKTIYLNQLRFLTQTTDRIEIEKNWDFGQALASENRGEAPRLKLAELQVAAGKKWVSVEQSKLLPDFTVGYFNQSLAGTIRKDGYVANAGNRFQGVIVGLNMPLWMQPQRGRIKAAQNMAKAAEKESELLKMRNETEVWEARENVNQARRQLEFLEQKSVPVAILIRAQALKGYMAGALGGSDLSAALKKAMNTEELLLDARYQLQLSLNQLEFLLGSN